MRGTLEFFLLVFSIVGCQSLEPCPSCSRKSDAIVFLPESNSQTTTNSALTKIYIAGLFPLHAYGGDGYSCGEIDDVQVLRMHAFFWAIRTLKDRLLTKPKVEIGGIVVDSCSNAYELVTQVSGIERCSSVVYHEQTKIKRTLIAAYVDFHTNFSESDNNRVDSALKGLNKPILKLIPQVDDADPDVFYKSGPIRQQIRGLVNVISHNHDAQVYSVVVYSDTPYHKRLFDIYQQVARELSICSYESIKITPNSDILAGVSQRKAFRFFVLLLTDYDMAQVIQETEKSGGSESIAFSVIFLVPDLSPAFKQILYKSRLGSVLLQYSPMDQSNRPATDSFFEQYRNMKPDTSSPASATSKYFNELWMKKFDCTSNVSNCDTDERLGKSDVQIDISDIVYGVDIVADGLEKAREQICGSGAIVCSEFQDWDKTTTTDVRHIVRKSAPYDGTRAFRNDPAHLLSEYKVLQLEPLASFREREFIQVGIVKEDGTFAGDEGIRAYDEDGEQSNPVSRCNEGDVSLCLKACSSHTSTTAPKTNEIKEPGDEKYQIFRGVPTIAFIPDGFQMPGSVINQLRSDSTYSDRYALYGMTWIFPIGVLSGLGMLVTIIVAGYIFRRVLWTLEEDKKPDETQLTVKFRTLFLSQVLLLGVFLSYLTLIAFIFVPTAATCGIIRFAVGFCYAVCFSAFVVKLLVLLKSRTSNIYLPGEVDSPNYLKGEYQVIIFCAALAVQVAICAQWLMRVPAGTVLVKSYADEPIWVCNHYTWKAGKNFWDMSAFVRSNTINHIMTLIYITILIVIAFVLAWKAQDITTNLKESRFIMFSILLTLPVWVAWQILAGLIHNYEHPYAHEIADASTAFGLFIIATIILCTMFMTRDRQLIAAGIEAVYLEDDREPKFYDTSSMRSAHDLANGSAYFVADGSMIDGSMGTVQRPYYMETSFNSPYPAFDKSMYDRSAYSTLDHRRGYPSSANLDRHASTLSRRLATLSRHASSTLGRSREGNLIYSESHSAFENDPDALHAKHPRSVKSELSKSTPNLNVAYSRPSTLKRDKRSQNGSRPSTLNRDKTGRSGRTDSSRSKSRRNADNGDTLNRTNNSSKKSRTDSSRSKAKKNDTLDRTDSGFRKTKKTSKRIDVDGLSQTDSGYKARTHQLSHDLTGRRIHATMYPSYASEVDDSTLKSSYNNNKRSQSYEGLDVAM